MYLVWMSFQSAHRPTVSFSSLSEVETHSSSPFPPSLLGTGPFHPVLGGSTFPPPPPPLPPFCAEASVELFFFGAIVPDCPQQEDLDWMLERGDVV